MKAGDWVYFTELGRSYLEDVHRLFMVCETMEGGNVIRAVALKDSSLFITASSKEVELFLESS